MFDRRLRRLSARGFDPAAAAAPGWLTPLRVVVAGFALGVGAAGAAAAGLTVVAVVLWLANRCCDGLDGAIARARGLVSDEGGYLDIVADVTVYALVPLGVAISADDRATWIATAVLLAAFYVNTISWTYLAALLERRGAGAGAGDERTSVTMPAGLVEGTETIVWFTLLLAVPALAPWWMGTMAAATLVGAGLRVAGGVRMLRTLPATEMLGDATGDRGCDPSARQTVSGP